jgi:hypothetical protein
MKEKCYINISYKMKRKSGIFPPFSEKNLKPTMWGIYY